MTGKTPVIQISNQKPADLSPVVQDHISKDFDPVAMIKDTIVAPVRNPLNPVNPVTVKVNGTDATDDDIAQLILACCQDTLDMNAETIIKDLYSQILLSYTKASILKFRMIYVVQSAERVHLPEPTATCIYTPANDVIPMARKFLGGQATYDEWFASLAFYATPQTLGFYFADDNAFNDFKAWFAQETAMIQASLPAQTVQLCQDFQTLTLTELTESLLLRNNDSDNNDPFSFARFLVNRLMVYSGQISQSVFGILPFDVAELICPKTIIFVNVERHARATARQVADEWKIINSSLKSKPAMVSISKLQKLTAMQRNIQKIQATAANAASNAMFQNALRAQNIAFRKTAPTTMDLARIIKKIMGKMAFVNKSMNSYKQIKMTYARPNRRDPDDFNKQGKMVSTKYKPDIHLYIDTSGSISEENYEEAVKACIAMAKKLNVSLYFNSFSHVLSQAAKLHTADKPVGAIYREFQKLPKVTGGTDYELVWNYINRSKKREREISILMTDFEYIPPNEHIDHPKNLYYIPIAHSNWDWISRSAEDFAKAMMTEGVTDIRKHILF